MISKLEQYKNNYPIQISRCPLCFSDFKIVDNSLICTNNHNFNINKKGYVNLEPQKNITQYNVTLFLKRNEIFTNHHYDQVFNEINKLIKNEGNTICDIGCGDGYLLNLLNGNTKIGLDLSNAAIKFASRKYPENTFIIGDLTNLPFKDNSLDYIINMLTPINYEAFKRVLKNDGYLIKVIPKQDYLKEIRQLFDKNDYDDSKVYDHLKQNVKIIKEIDIHYQTRISDEEKVAFISMSPLTWSISDDIKQEKSKALPNDITISLKVLLTQY